MFSIFLPLLTPLLGTIFLGVARAVLTAAGGYLIHSGAISMDQTVAIIGLLVTGLGMVWSMAAKFSGTTMSPTINTAELQAAIVAALQGVGASPTTAGATSAPKTS